MKNQSYILSLCCFVTPVISVILELPVGTEITANTINCLKIPETPQMYRELHWRTHLRFEIEMFLFSSFSNTAVF